MTTVLTYVAALIPFLGGALIFYVIMKNILQSDRNERIAVRRWEEQHQSTKPAAGRPPQDSDSSS
ncbi:MAG: hypothetical protein ACK5MP_09365 [Nostocoides sp.]